MWANRQCSREPCAEPLPQHPCGLHSRREPFKKRRRNTIARPRCTMSLLERHPVVFVLGTVFMAAFTVQVVTVRIQRQTVRLGGCAIHVDTHASFTSQWTAG